MFNRLFTNDKVFFIVILLAVAGELIYGVIDIKMSQFMLMDAISKLAMAACLIVLYVSYKNHDKNVMKCVMGALLMAQFLNAAGMLTTSQMKFNAYAYLILSAAVLITHLLINRSHSASPVKIVLNRIFLLLIAVDIVIMEVSTLSIMVKVFPVFAIISFLADVVGTVFLCGAVVCVESKLDLFRNDREEAGWTEETGYPEGYVHEYEKR